MKRFGFTVQRVRQIRAKDLHKGQTIVSRRGNRQIKHLIDSVEEGPLDLIRIRTQNATLTLHYEADELLTVESEGAGP